MRPVSMLDLGSEYRYMQQDIDAAIRNCLAHQQWIFGPEIAAFENTVAGYLDVRHCIAVSSGTEALVLSLRASAIQRKGEEYFSEDDEIITTPFTFTATGDAIIRSGATPVFVDIDPITYNIDVLKVRDYLGSSSGRAVAGIIPVHLYGRAVDMDTISEIAVEHDVFVIEDVAQAFGGTWKARKLGSLGSTGAFSFFPSKNLGSFGDAGMVATNDGETAELLRMLIKHGGKDKYNVDHIGYNGRMDTLQAAILLAKFKYIEEFNSQRQRIAKFYTEKLSGIDGLFLPVGDDDLSLSSASGTRHVFHQYTIRTKERDALQAYLKKEGVSAMVYYPTPLHKMKVFEGRMKQFGNLTNTERAVKEVLSLPVGPLQTEEDSAFVADCVRGFFGY